MDKNSKMKIDWNALVIEKKNLWSTGITMLAALLTYYPMAINWLGNPDSVWNSIVFRNGHGSERMNGRILQIVLDKFHMNMVTPLLVTVICAILLGITAFSICRIYESDNAVADTILGLVIVFAPCTSSSMTYFYCAESFMLAYALAAAAVFFVVKYPGKWSYILSMGMLAASLYLYQAYICVTFALAVTVLLMDLLDAEKAVRQAVANFIRLVVVCVAAVISYIASFKVIQIVFHIDAASSRGFDSMGKLSLSDIPRLIEEAYINFYEYFWGNRLLNNEFGDRNIINIFVVFVGVTIIVCFIIRQKLWKSPVKLVMVCLAVLLLPLAFEAITVMSPKVDKYDTTGIIMIPTMAVLYCFVLGLGVQMKGRSTQRAKWWFYAALLVNVMFLWNSIVFTNLCVNYMQLNKNKADTVAGLMLDDITDLYGFKPEQKLLIAGSMEDGNFPQVFEWPYDSIKGTSASFGFMWDTYTGNECCWIEFLRQYHGMQYTACSTEEYEKVLEMEEYQKMPLFPENGSVQMIDDMIVVKMSNVVLK